MKNEMRTTEEHAGDWRFASREPESARRLTVHPDGMDTVLLVADEEGGWWAVAGSCRNCGNHLEAQADLVHTPASEVHCRSCGAAHGPGVEGCRQIPTLVVDEEIYLLASDGDEERG